MAEIRWTPKLVEARLEEAADALRRLPEERARGYFSLWPNIIYEFSDLVGQEPPRLRLPPPSAAVISRMDEALTWLHWLEAEDAKLVWQRAEGTRWKIVCWRFGISRATAWRRWVMALCRIAMELNGEQVPRSRAQLNNIALRRSAQ